MEISLRFIGTSEEDLRWFIIADGRHAGGITVHNCNPPAFSYGIAVSPHMRRIGVAKAALSLLFSEMTRRGFTEALVSIHADNAASLALHESLGFHRISIAEGVIRMKKALT